MRLATPAESRLIEKSAVSDYKLNNEILMESAGSLSAREIQVSFYPELTRGMTAIVCGPGNNGGDGLVVARHLHALGHRDIAVFLVGSSKRSELNKIQLKRIEAQGFRIVDLASEPKKIEQLKSAALIIDAIFGTGFKARSRADIFTKVIQAINSWQVPVVSLDAPSGLECESGIVEALAVKAAMTLTYGLAKPGFFVADGPSHVGRLRVLSIGFPHEAVRKIATTYFLFDEKLAKRYLPPRKDRSNKSDHGHLLVLAGSPGYWGAGILAASSAYRIGAGYVTWASYEAPNEALKEAPEIMTRAISDPQIWQKNKYSAVAIGPGLGVSDETGALLKKLIKAGYKNVILDADAITCAVKEKLFPLPKTWVLTPHAGELSRILKKSVRDIERNRFEAALEAAKVTGCHVLVKGFRSVLAYEKRCMVIQSGNAALAKAGTGDVLTGMIGGLLAQGLDTVQATATAAYIHGRLADEWVCKGNDKRSLTASDLREDLPLLLGRISGGVIL